jgi:hypothetical protein
MPPGFACVLARGRFLLRLITLALGKFRAHVEMRYVRDNASMYLQVSKAHVDRIAVFVTRIGLRLHQPILHTRRVSAFTRVGFRLGGFASSLWRCASVNQDQN